MSKVSLSPSSLKRIMQDIEGLDLSDSKKES